MGRSISSPNGYIRPMVAPAIRHIINLWESPEYRFLQRLNRLNHLLPRFQKGNIKFGRLLIQYVDIASLFSAWDEIFVNQIYDIGEQNDNPPFLIDAGANIGLALLYWKLRYPNFKGIAFEPDPTIAEVLHQNVTAWGISVNIIQAALGNKEGSADFSLEGADAGHVISDEETNLTKKIRVPVQTLSPYLDRPVSLLKIDIEGTEHEVIEEIYSKLQFVRSIFVECHSFTHKTQDYGSILHMLQDAGFRCQLQVLSSDKKPFQKAQLSGSENMDFNFNIFGTRLPLPK